MDANERRRLLGNLWYVDENLKLTDDSIKSVGFIDLVLGDGTYYFIITFFERIGVAKSSIEARNLIEQWLKYKFSTHRLVIRKSTFEPVIPLATSVALCNENSAQHGREMFYCWGLLPDEGKIHIDDINYRLDIAIPIKNAGKFGEKDSGAMVTEHQFVYDLKEAFNVFPAVIIDYNEFPVHCQNVDLMDCRLYSNTHSLRCYNEAMRMEYGRKLRAPAILKVRIEIGHYGLAAGAVENFLDGFKK